VRCDEEDHVGLGKQPVQIPDGAHLRRPGAAAARHARDRGDLEALQPPLDRLADVAVADDQHPLVGQGPAEHGTPGARVLAADEAVQAPPAGQREGYRQLGGAGVVQAGRVA